MIALLDASRQLLADVLRFAIVALRPTRIVAAENLFLRRQLALYVERGVKPCRPDVATRVSLALLSRLFDWRTSLAAVRPETLIRWHRAGFRLLWRLKSRPGRTAIQVELRQLIRRMATDNPLWGEERIANELLLKLGLRLSPRTVQKYLPKRPPGRPRGDRRWSTFLRNHARASVACWPTPSASARSARFVEEGDASRPSCLLFRVRLRVRGDENDRRRNAACSEPLLQVEAGHAAQLNVQHQAVRLRSRRIRQESFRGRITHRIEAGRAQQPCEGVPNAAIVVHHGDVHCLRADPPTLANGHREHGAEGSAQCASLLRYFGAVARDFLAFRRHGSHVAPCLR